MNNIDPVWQSEEDEEPVEVTVKKPVPEANSEGAVVSRRPAAIVGMLIVIGIGFSFFQGVENLTGQLTDGSNVKTVTITANGFEPARIEVEHGQTITWVNNQDVPHIIESETLCSDTGFCLMSSTLFNGDSDNFTITPDIQPGSYTYTSSISAELIGEVVVVTQIADDFIDIENIIGNDFFADPVGTTTAPPDSADNFNPQDFAPPPQENTGLPTNPYAIGSERIHPFDGSGNPIPEAFGDDPNEATANQVAATAIAQGRGPLRQPETGAGVWGVIFGSIAGLYMVTRNSFAKVAQVRDHLLLPRRRY